MAIDFSTFGIERMTDSERWELVGFIVARMQEQNGPIEFSDEQIAEIKRRRAAADADPSRGRTAREVMAEIRAEL